MADIWVISDTHFGHENIIKYCNRPFENTYYMNQCIRDNWNSTVKDGDKVYHLGDVYMSKSYFSGEPKEQFLTSLKGKKRLILGNHDNGKDQILQRVFKKINVWRMFPEFGLMLTHVPIHRDSFRHKCSVNVHGHVHNRSLKDREYKNVSVEAINYTPINIDELRV